MHKAIPEKDMERVLRHLMDRGACSRFVRVVLFGKYYLIIPKIYGARP